MTRMTPSEAFVETLLSRGVTTVFGIVGSAYMDALDIFPPAGIRFLSTAHEQGAAHMADGYARISGRHGVCIAQNGPGVTNFVTAIAAAYWAHSPVVCITPETGTATQGLGGFQETEQLPFFEKITKYQAHVNRSDRIAEFTARCLDIAMLENGPTQLNIPRDLFYGAIDTEIPPPTPIERAAGGPRSLQQAAEILSHAKFPVVIAGGGVVNAGGIPETIALADYLHAPVVNSYLHNDSFPCDHELWCGPLGYQGSKAAMNLLRQADVVLAVGTRLGPFGTLPQHGIDYWPKEAQLIQIDSDPRMLGLTRPAAVAIAGDARLAAAALLEALRAMEKPLACHANRARRGDEIAERKQEWEANLNEWGQQDGSPIAPRRALRELEKAHPEQVMISTDIGNICSVANSYLRFSAPRSMLAAMSFGNCGYAFPAAIGAKLAAPERPALAYVGDGAWGMSFGELLTCVRESIPVVAVVFNNGQWGAEKKNQVDFFSHRYVGTNLANPSFAAIAEAMGALGIRVETPDGVGDSLRAALASERPAVVEIMTTDELGEPFRRDALAKPKRFLEKYKSFE